jgi:hypothetical protein
LNRLPVRSGELSGKFDSAIVTWVLRPQSSLRVCRINSDRVSTRIVSSIIFDRANRGLLMEALAPEEAGASLATGTK